MNAVNLKNFETAISSTIVKRGKTYYKNGHVFDLQQLSTKQWEAQVEGSDNYTVTVELSDHFHIVDSLCNCPYDGPFCKHEVAVFYELQKEPKQNIPEIALQPLLEKEKKEQLIAFLVKIAEEEPKLKQKILQAFSQKLKPKAEPNPVKRAIQIIDKTTKNALRSRYISWEDSHTVIDDLEQVLAEIDILLAKNELDQAFKFLLLCYEKAILLLDIAEDPSLFEEILYTCTNEIHDLIETNIDGWSKSEQQQYFEQIVNCTQQLDGEIYHTLALLEEALPFCHEDKQNNRFQAYLASLPASNNYVKQDIQNLQLKALLLTDNLEAIDTFISLHEDNPQIRETLIEQAFLQKKYEQVLTLCADGIEQHAEHRNLRLKWERFAYEAHKQLGNKEAMRAIAFPLAIEGSADDFAVLKSLYTETEWPDILQDLLLAFEEMPNYPYWYPTIVIEEQQWSYLLQYCKKNPTLLESYANYLIQDYREDVKTLFMQKLTKEATTASNRSHYQAIRKILQNFKDLGYTEAVAAIITQLQEQYPKRPALHDELSQIK